MDTPSNGLPSADEPISYSIEGATEGQVPKSRPLPVVQLGVLLCVLLCEPMSSCVIFPFIAKLVDEVADPKKDEASTGYYVGLIESLFFLAQGLCVLQWGRLSDKIGRRPVLLLGLIGLCLSMISFGLSRTFVGLIVSRAIAGLLSGNIGITKTMMAELTDESNRAFAFSLFPVTWVVGATLAPLIGGALQHPAETYPKIFHNPFWSNYPYFLPCSIVALFSGLTYLVVLMCLRETLLNQKRSYHDKTYSPIPDPPVIPSEDRRAHPQPQALTKPVMFAILNYGCLAILEISYLSLMTVFLAVPIASGGLGLLPSEIGIILSLIGLFSGTIQVTVFPKAFRRWGAKPVLHAAFLSFLVLFSCFPLMHIMASTSVDVDGPLPRPVWGIMGLMVVSSAVVDMGFSCAFIYTTAACPSPKVLGTVNGYAQMVISFTRALGPAGATTLFALSVENNWAGGYAVFWFFMGLTLVALWCTRFLPKEPSPIR